MSETTDAVTLKDEGEAYLVFNIFNINHENYRDIGQFVEENVAEHKPKKIAFDLFDVKHIPTVGHSVFIRSMNKFDFLENITFIGTQDQVREALDWVLQDRPEADSFTFADSEEEF